MAKTATAAPLPELTDDMPHLLPALPEEEDDGDSGAKYAEDADVLEAVKELERDGLLLRQSEEYDWQETWRFYNGHHWTTWNNDGQITEIEPDDVPRIVLNFILHMVQTRLGHLIKNRPVLQGMPQTSEEEARNASRLAVQAILAYWKKCGCPKKLAEALMWMLICGKCFWKIYFDPTGGPLQSKPGPTIPVTDESGAPVNHPATGQQLQREGPPVQSRRGALRLEVAFPHEILVEPGALDLDRAQRLLHTTYKPLAEAQAIGDMDDDEVKSLRDAGADDDASLRARRQLEGLDQVAGIDLKGRTPVKELWVKPNEKWKQGLWAIVINGKVRKSAPLPSWCGEEDETELPFVEFDEIRTNSFWSTSTARQMRDINRIVNIEVSQQEHLRKVLRYKTLIPEQSNIDKEAFDQRDDEAITYWHPYAPSHLKPPELPQHHVEIRNSLITMMKEIGGNWDVLAGKTQGEVRSGRQTAYLQEYAGTVLGVVAQQIEWAIESAGNKMLRILQECFDDEQLETFVGANKRVQVVAFRGIDLKSCARISVQAGSALPISRTEKWDRIEHWMEMKWLDPQIGLRLLDLGDFDTEIYGDEEQDRTNADELVWMLENVTDEQMKAAYPDSVELAAKDECLWSERYLLRALKIEAFPFDNHKIHVQQIDRACRKTNTYRRQWSPAKRALADALVEWHAMLDDPMHGPIEQSIGAPPSNAGALLPPGATPPPDGAPPGGSAAPPGAEKPLRANGSPQSMQGHPEGGGGVGGGGGRGLPESGAERAAGLPGVPRPPGPGPGA